jgi:RNA polymerase II subunit A small phosphatase-like protein
VLDLDETLIYGCTNPLGTAPDFTCGDYFIYKRPFVDGFIRACAATFRLAVWTSSTDDYAACIVSHLFAEASLEFVWSRERCTNRWDQELQEHYWVKDLKKVKRAGHDLERVLIVDDTPKKIERNYGNLVLVREFTGDPGDDELAPLADYLVSIAGLSNLRDMDKRNWRHRR